MIIKYKNKQLSTKKQTIWRPHLPAGWFITNFCTTSMFLIHLFLAVFEIRVILLIKTTSTWCQIFEWKLEWNVGFHVFIAFQMIIKHFSSVKIHFNVMENEMWEAFLLSFSLYLMILHLKVMLAEELHAFSCFSTTPTALLFGFWSDWHAIFIHTPTLSSLHTSGWPTLLLSEETSLVTVWHVDIMMRLNQVGIKTCDQCP